MLRAIAAAIGSVLVRLLDILAWRHVGRREAAQDAKIEAVTQATKAKDAREEIENEVAADPDLVKRAARAGIVRGPKPAKR